MNQRQRSRFAIMIYPTVVPSLSTFAFLVHVFRACFCVFVLCPPQKVSPDGTKF